MLVGHHLRNSSPAAVQSQGKCRTTSGQQVFVAVRRPGFCVLACKLRCSTWQRNARACHSHRRCLASAIVRVLIGGTAFLNGLIGLRFSAPAVQPSGVSLASFKLPSMGLSGARWSLHTAQCPNAQTCQNFGILRFCCIKSQDICVDWVKHVFWYRVFVAHLDRRTACQSLLACAPPQCSVSSCLELAGTWLYDQNRGDGQVSLRTMRPHRWPP